MSSEGLGESEEVREGGRGSRALSQSLGLSPKEGYTLSSSSGLDPPTPEQRLTSPPPGFPGPVLLKPSIQGQGSTGVSCFSPVPGLLRYSSRTTHKLLT